MHNKQKLCAFFQSTGMINAINAEEIAGYFDEMVLQKNELMLREGQVSNNYLLLEEGFMRAYATDPEGNEVTTAFYAPVQVVFEPASFFLRIPSKETLHALTPCRGWVTNFEKLNGLFHSLPQFREFGRGILVKGFATLKMRMLSIITETAEERYAALLKDNPEIFQYAPLKYIASHLGVTDTSLSRIRKEMAQKQ